MLETVTTQPVFGIWSDRPLTRFALQSLLQPEFPEYTFRMEGPAESSDARPSQSTISNRQTCTPWDKSPELMIFELSPYYGAGLSEAMRYLAHMREPKMLILTTMKDTHHVGQVLATGAMGCLSNRSAPEEIISAMRQISQGQVFVSDPAARDFLRHRSVFSRKQRSPQETTDPISRLTQREFEVFQLFGTGFSTKQIAHRLSLNVHTIETYRERIRMRIHARDGSELIYRAILWCVMND